MTTDHLAGDPPPEEATDASADRAAPAPDAPDATAPGPDRDTAPAPDAASAAAQPGGDPPSAPGPAADSPHPAEAGPPDTPAPAAAPEGPGQPGAESATLGAEPDSPAAHAPGADTDTGTGAEPTGSGNAATDPGQRDAGSAAARAEPDDAAADALAGADAEPTETGAAVPGQPPAADAQAAAGADTTAPAGAATGTGVPGAGAQAGAGGSAESAGGPSAQAPGGGGKGGRSAAAEALAAAVRAVESGERSAASFFNEPRPAPARPQPAAAPAREPARAAAPAPVAPPARPAAAGVAGVREVLAAGGAPEALAVSVAETLGERAAEALREDPWQLLAVPGVRPEQADGFARALLGPECGPGDERRSQALTGWLLERAALEGHTALESSALRAALAKVSVPDPDEALRAAIAGGGVLVFQDALEAPAGARPPAGAAPDDEDAEQPVRVLLGLDRYALAEESLADGFARLITTFADAHKDDAPDWEAAAGAAPSPSAAELIRTAAAHGLVTHSGGEAARAEPAALVAAARSMGLRVCAAAHSEDGRRRLAAVVGADAAVTVAGLLSGGEGPGRDEDGALALDLIAVLDAPQLDVEAAAMLVESLPDGARLVLSGDPGVLWSAGPGRVFADLLAARRCPQVVSRTPDPGPIGELVSGIGIGELNQVEAPGKEVVIVPVRDPGEAVHRTVQLVADSVPRAIGVPSEQTQVITPGHGGAAGTRALNAALKERLNPGPGRFAGFDPGDRVAYTPAPGRALPGTVVSADAEGLRLDCAGAPVVVPREQVGDLVRHGWALTAHQAAGMRWPAAVVVLPGDAAPGLTRAWVYTAFSRGERHLSVVQGAEAALPRAVAEIPFKDRTTRLRSLLQAEAPPTG
ncbi:helix-hairpin-helix domain-containing protein [Streptomyces sp. RTd22]|uniref:helix-hairpin-helix domain-containing protein n=1 Tax=Streptomyces sp. RTd22 TaxID=1841249 RepID=UPI0007C575E2|nr:helix-hairpin-helix domain-containing protein [Streptomyces sp. RTd22]